jgi:hypothetical protein
MSPSAYAAVCSKVGVPPDGAGEYGFGGGFTVGCAAWVVAEIGFGLGRRRILSMEWAMVAGLVLPRRFAILHLIAQDSFGRLGCTCRSVAQKRKITRWMIVQNHSGHLPNLPDRMWRVGRPILHDQLGHLLGMDSAARSMAVE